MSRSFKLKPTTAHERFGDETVIVNLESGNYYSTQAVGNVVFSLVIKGASEATIEQHIKSRFLGNSEQISGAIAKFLDQLVDESLVDAETLHHGADGGGEGEMGKPENVFLAPVLEKYTDMNEMLVLDPIHDVDERGWPSARLFSN